MSGSVRVRRQTSPAGRHQPPATSQRFPHPRHEHLDADERREAASKGLRPGRKSHPTGGLNIAPGEWKLLALILVIAALVRLFRISQPNSVVYVSLYLLVIIDYMRVRAADSMKCTSASSRPSTSSPPTSWMCTPRLPSCLSRLLVGSSATMAISTSRTSQSLSLLFLIAVLD